MIRPSKFSLLLDKIFPTHSRYVTLKSAQQQQLKIVWYSLALLLAFFVFLILFYLNRNSTVLPPNLIPPSVAVAQNNVPGQPLEMAISGANYTTDPNLTVTNGRIESNSNYVTVRLQVGGRVLQGSDNLAVYQVAFDTDQDPNTGFLFPKLGVGAEFLADFDSAGNALLQHWIADQHRFETIKNGLSEYQLDDKTIVFEVSRAALGFPDQLNLALIAADNAAKLQTFLPENGFAHYQFQPQGLTTANQVLPIWPITVNSTKTDQINTLELSRPADASLDPDFDIIYSNFVANSTTLTVTVKVAGKIISNPTNKSGNAFYQLLLDTDSNTKGYFSIDRLNLDAKYIADYDSNGFNSILRWLPKTTKFEGVGGLIAKVSGNTITFVVPLESIGNPLNLNLALLATNNLKSQQNYFPDRSTASLDIPVNSILTPNTSSSNPNENSADKPLQVKNLNLQVKDSFLDAALTTNAPFDFNSEAQASYQLFLGNPITQTSTITSTKIISNNVIAPKLQVYYKVVFSPGISKTQAQLLAWSEKDQNFDKVQDIDVINQDSGIQFQVPLSVIGSGLFGYYVATYNPQDNFSSLFPQSEPGKVMLSGSSHFVVAPSQSATTNSSSLISNVDLQNKTSTTTFTVNTNVVLPDKTNAVNFINLQFWIDNDNNLRTGSTDLYPTLGIDDLLKYDSRVDSSQLQIYTYDQITKSFVLNRTVAVHVSSDGKQLTFDLNNGLLNSGGFRMVVYANSPTFNTTQILPGGGEDYAQINFQLPSPTQTLTPTVQQPSNTNQPYLNLKQFNLKYDNLFVTGTFVLSALPKAGDNANYSVNLAAFAPDTSSEFKIETSPNVTSTYYTVIYNTKFDRAVLKRWSEKSQAYEFVTQIDRVLDAQKNQIELILPYSLLGQAEFVNYLAAVSDNLNSAILPDISGPDKAIVPALDQPTATFYFKGPNFNNFSNSDMKQTVITQR